MPRSSVATICSVVVVVLVECLAGGGCKKTSTAPSPVTFSQTDITVGSGAPAVTSHVIFVAYTGWLYDSSKTDGKGSQFDSSPSFSFTLGVGQVIKGWDQGIPGMKVGGQRRLLIPPDLAYGSAGAGGGAIPPNASLVFDVTLLSVQ